MANVNTKSVLEPANCTFRHDPWGRLLLQHPGQKELIPVDPVRAFPLTHPEGHISLLDDQGHEVLRIDSLNELPTEQREILLRELADREFSPVIQRILQVGAAAPPCMWDVETDRGRTQFELDSEDDLRRLPDGTVLIADANGIRFRIPNVDQLDRVSRGILRRFL